MDPIPSDALNGSQWHHWLNGDNELASISQFQHFNQGNAGEALGIDEVEILHHCEDME